MGDDVFPSVSAQGHSVEKVFFSAAVKFAYRHHPHFRKHQAQVLRFCEVNY